ncbi:MAG: von Willebrand factor type A domain-containing protein [Brevundimonas sp.]|uniref:vWA domain-containing protein n=1 Tax=Brevundimonas sp. TaxID=1871086 RepID=UPI0024878333|nr:von Willebrand factor type A domain-containing protein [Brevundimonas sp.]MDI1325981.1 von Willebrand factor type A domain-containing protein [Brevundimonas sp.]
MTVVPLKQAMAGVMSLALASPVAPGALAQSGGRPIDPDKPSDGVVSAAACAPFGFNIPDRTSLEHVVVTGSRITPGAPVTGGPPPPMPMAPPPPPPPPPPPAYVAANGTLAIAPTQRQDRLAPASPPVIGRITQPDTERYPDATPNPVRRVADEPVSTFSIDVDTASYSNVRRFIDEGRAPPADAVRVEEMINYFDYGYDRPASATQPFAVTTAVAASPWSPGRQIVHVGLQGYELPADEQRPLNLTFMVDVSGSMQTADKLALAKKSMNLIIDRLRPQDRVAVTFYASDVGTAVGPTPGDQKLKLRCAVETLNAGGSTAGAQGMVNAYQQAEAAFGRDKVNRILMFTDGDFNVGVTDNQRIEDYVAAKRGTGIYLSVYGFGRGNYQDDRMQTIAQAGNGVAAYVDDLNEARRLFGPAFGRGAFPIADDVKIQVEFNPARVSEYRLIGYETRLLNEEDFANDRIDAGEVGSGASVTALYEITPVGGPSQIPERRYDQNRIGVGGGDPDGEVGFVQVRYKLPGERDSRLMQHVLSNAGGGRVSAQPPESTRWAMAVAAFGQRLRGDPWMAEGYGWNDILEQAQGARGEDPYGERAEFVQMVRAAQGLPARARP